MRGTSSVTHICHISLKSTHTHRPRAHFKLMYKYVKENFMDAGRSSFSLTLLFFYLLSSFALLISPVFIFLFFLYPWIFQLLLTQLQAHQVGLPLGGSSSVCGCVCVFLQAIEAGGRRIPLRSQPKGIQPAIPDHSGEILLFRDNSRMTLVFGVCEMVSHHHTVGLKIQLVL